MLLLRVFFAALLIAQPTTDPASESDLRRVIVSLQARISVLQKENADLKRQLSGRASTAPAAPKSTFASRAEDYIKGGRAAIERTGTSQRVVPMQIQPAEAQEARANAAKHDKAIADYLAAHDVPKDEANALYEGRPSVGMSLDELRLLGNVSVKGETASGQAVSLYVWTPAAKTWEQQAADTYHIELADGKVATVERATGL